MKGTGINQSFLPLSKVQELYGVSKDFLYKLRREQGLKIWHLGSKPFVKPEDLESLMTLEEVAVDKK